MQVGLRQTGLVEVSAVSIRLVEIGSMKDGPM
jgi:hypothetical protein